jgi:hypothetical protein
LGVGLGLIDGYFFVLLLEFLGFLFNPRQPVI